MQFRTILVGKTKDGYYYQFNVALEKDDGTPLMVSLGWRLANLSQVMPPQTRSKNGVLFAVIQLPDPEFIEQIKRSILKKIDPDGTMRSKQEMQNSRRDSTEPL